MITVGVVRELAYMSGYVGVEVCTSIDVSGKIIGLRVSENYVKISYQGQKIWEENIYGEGNWFGIESCDTIYRIMECIDKGEPWQKEHGWSKSDNTRHVPLDEAIEEALET
jgi:hypothetical protein